MAENVEEEKDIQRFTITKIWDIYISFSIYATLFPAWRGYSLNRVFQRFFFHCTRGGISSQSRIFLEGRSFGY